MIINILLLILILLICISIHKCQRRIDDFKSIGLGDYKFAGDLNFDGVWIYKSRLRWVDLTKVDIADKLCEVNYESFDKCKEDYHNVKVMMSTDRSDMIPRKLKGTIDMNTNISFDERMTVPYAPNLYAVKNVFLNSWGFIFNHQELYMHGACTDRALYHPAWHYNLSEYMNTDKLHMFYEPIISLVHPYSTFFYHEWIEVYSKMMICLKLFEKVPHLTIVVTKELRYPQLFPLLNATGFDVSKYKILALGKNKLVGISSFLAYAPYIITPASPWCEFISSSMVKQMRDAYSTLPNWDADGSNILLYDRYNNKPRRYLSQGVEVQRRLISLYGKKRKVIMYHGNETLEDTFRLFRSSKIVVAVHGGALSNIMVMRPGSIVIEIRPMRWPNRCFIDLCDEIGITHYLYSVDTNLKQYEMYIDMPHFMGKLTKIIDNYFRHHP